MSELAQKLARRRQLNGEASGAVSAPAEGAPASEGSAATDLPTHASSTNDEQQQPQPDSRRLSLGRGQSTSSGAMHSFQSSLNSTKTGGDRGESASELTAKLARRRAMNGEATATSTSASTEQVVTSTETTTSTDVTISPVVSDASVVVVAEPSSSPAPAPSVIVEHTPDVVHESVSDIKEEAMESCEGKQDPEPMENVVDSSASLNIPCKEEEQQAITTEPSESTAAVEQSSDDTSHIINEEAHQDDATTHDSTSTTVEESEAVTSSCDVVPSSSTEPSVESQLASPAEVVSAADVDAQAEATVGEMQEVHGDDTLIQEAVKEEVNDAPLEVTTVDATSEEVEIISGDSTAAVEEDPVEVPDNNIVEAVLEEAGVEYIAVESSSDALVESAADAAVQSLDSLTLESTEASSDGIEVVDTEGINLSVENAVVESEFLQSQALDLPSTEQSSVDVIVTPSVASDERDDTAPVAVVKQDSTEDEVPVQAAESKDMSTPTRVSESVPKAEKKSEGAIDTMGLSDLQEFDDFLGTIDTTKLARPEPATQTRRTATKSIRGGLFADDYEATDETRVELFAASKFVLPKSSDLTDAEPLEFGTKRRRSGFGKSLRTFGFNDDKVGDMLKGLNDSFGSLGDLSFLEESTPGTDFSIFNLDSSFDSKNTADSLFSPNFKGPSVSSLPIDFMSYKSDYLSSGRDGRAYTNDGTSYTQEDVDNAQSRLNSFGLFGESAAPSERVGESAETHGDAPVEAPVSSPVQSAPLFKDEIVPEKPKAPEVLPVQSNSSGSTSLWASKKFMTYDEYLFFMNKPECFPLADAVRRFIYSILGPRGDGIVDKRKNYADTTKGTSLGNFIGTERLDERCNDFFGDMQHHFSQHNLLEGCSEDFFVSMRDGLERYVMGKISKVAFGFVEDLQEDAALHRRMKCLSFVTPEALDIKPELRNDIIWALAKDELRKMNLYSTPADKVACVVRCAAVLFRSLNMARAAGDDTSSAGADDFLPIFIYVVMHSNVDRLFSNCEYIQRFHNPFHLMSRSGYCFVNLRSAMEFVMNVDSSMLSMDPEEFEKSLAAAEASLGKDAASPRSVGAAAFKCIETVIIKTEYGIGLDLAQCLDDRAVIRRFKDMPEGVTNPATLCDPPIEPGDVIDCVNGVPCPTIFHTAEAIKKSENIVKLTIHRT